VDTIIVIASIAIAVVAVLFLIATYNRLVRLRNRSENAWAQIDVQLKRRADLVPNLVESVRAYAAHERETFQAVTEARAAAGRARTIEQRAEAENALTAALGRLLAVAEAYPELRATEQFQDLQRQLEETEEKIAVSRQVYNDTVLTYETARETFPTNLLAGMLGFGPREYFEVEGAAREAPQVKF
jgi:LemA protein